MTVRATVARVDGAPRRWTVTVQGETSFPIMLRALQRTADEMAGEPTVLVWPTELAELLDEKDARTEAAREAAAAAAAARVRVAQYLRGPDPEAGEYFTDIGLLLGLTGTRVKQLLDEADVAGN